MNIVKQESPSTVMVSVIMITYNHELFISKAIEGVLMQQTKFPIELIIADDASLDKSQSIILNYANRYPKIIKPILRNQNIGANYNWIDAYKKCQGKYIAICEGDDYWTEQTKLQMQVDFLEKNNGYQMIFHNAIVVYPNGIKNSHNFYSLKDGDYSGEEILNNWVIPTASVVFRNNLNIPELLLEALHSDIFLFLLNAEKGKIYGMKEPLSIYRKVASSVTNSHVHNIGYTKRLIVQMKNMDVFFNFQYSSVIRKKSFYLHLALLKAYKFNMQHLKYIYLLIYVLASYPKLSWHKTVKYLNFKD